MTYEEFEWHILRMVYERGLERIQPAYIAYALGLPHEKTTDYLEQAAHAGVLEMEVTDDGHLEYFVPGVDPDAPMPDPVWKKRRGGQGDSRSGADRAATLQLEEEPSREMVEKVDKRLAEASDVVEARPLPDDSSRGDSSRGPRHSSVADQESVTVRSVSPGRSEAPGHTDGDRSTSRPAPEGRVGRSERSGSRDRGSSGQSRRGDDERNRQTALARRSRVEDAPLGQRRESKVPRHQPARQKSRQDSQGADGSLRGADGAVATREELPTDIRDHILDRSSAADGTVDSTTDMTVVDREASVNSQDVPPVVAALENSDRDLPIQIESTEETFSDPSQTIFMRRLRVEGVESEEALREHVHRLFDSLGYQMVEREQSRMRFERGSVTFILALVPLFVLVLPLFVYLFLYCMGRSTIHQEPLELDVQMRRHKDRDDVYDIDLTFIGLHGVVLGAADQRVLNKEVDTLRDELQWALGAT